MTALARGHETIDRRNFVWGMTAGLAGCSAAQTSAAPDRPRFDATPRALKLIGSARAQLGVTLYYDSTYTGLPFPNGDVPREKGVCTDVLIRAYRDAFGIDLQALVNADMRAAFGAYPKKWGLRAPDRNIDHRRVPNLRIWLARRRAALPIPAQGSGWQPGDIFTSLISGKFTHIGLVSDRPGRQSPRIIHNIGGGAREEDALLDWPITGRYRWQV
jgi:uncharacterized protein YijF (DUF1287 family)